MRDIRLPSPPRAEVARPEVAPKSTPSRRLLTCTSSKRTGCASCRQLSGCACAQGRGTHRSIANRARHASCTRG
eukprot:1153998-Prymnesium_polylepis.1